MEEKYIESLLRMVPHFTKQQNMWVKYDQDVDVLYVDVLNSDRVDNAILTEDNIIIRYVRDEVAGITVLDASSRKPPIITEEFIREYLSRDGNPQNNGREK